MEDDKDWFRSHRYCATVNASKRGGNRRKKTKGFPITFQCGGHSVMLPR